MQQYNNKLLEEILIKTKTNLFNNGNIIIFNSKVTTIIPL